MTSAQRSYFAFTRAVRDSQGISFKQAQQVYRAFKERGVQPRGVDVARHPRIISRLASATKPVPVSVRERGARAGEVGAGPEISRGRRVDLDTWIDDYYDFDDYEEYDIESGIDYKKGR